MLNLVIRKIVKYVGIHRVRYSKNPNAFSTAENVWKTIHKPITLENITTGLNIKNDDDMYYDTKKIKKVFSLVFINFII